jgi:hypothetical protein
VLFVRLSWQRESGASQFSAADESVPGPLHDLQAVRHIVCRAVVTRHSVYSSPRKVIVEDISEPLVAGKADVFQRLIETGDGPLIHLFVWSVAAVNPHDGGFAAILFRIYGRPTERFHPVCGEAFSVLRVESMAERMANHFVLQDPRVPRTGQPQQPVETTCGFIDRLHWFQDCITRILAE